MLSSLLKKFGLSPRETQIYLQLLRNGTQSTSILAKRCELNRGTTFLTLKELVKKGLASRITKGGVQYHSAISPRYLNSLLERKKEEVMTLEQDLREGLPLLESLENPLSPRPKIHFFEGREGLRALVEDTLTASDKKLCGILSMADLYEVCGEEWFEHYVARRIEKGVALRVMRNKVKDVRKRWLNNPQELRELRYLPRDMIFPATMYLYDGKVCFLSSEKEDFGLLIESQEIYQIQMKLFETLWENASKPS